jgi:hypothetical protein
MGDKYCQFRKDIQIWDVTNEAVNHISWDEATV